VFFHPQQATTLLLPLSTRETAMKISGRKTKKTNFHLSAPMSAKVKKTKWKCASKVVLPNQQAALFKCLAVVTEKNMVALFD
jgi:hypothetical protein